MYAHQKRMHRKISQQQASSQTALAARALECTTDASSQVEIEMKQVFETLFEQSGIGKCLCDVQGRVLKVNQTLCQLLGYQPSQLQQGMVSDWFSESEQLFLTSTLSQLAKHQLKSYQTEKQLLRRDGSLVSARLHFICLPELEQVAPSLLLEIQDLSSEQAIEQASDSELQRLRQAGHLAKVNYAMLDLQTGEVYWSQEFYELLGLRPGTVKLSKFEQLLKQFIYPEDQALVTGAIDNLILSGEGSRTLRFRVVRSDGQIRLIQAQVDLLTDPDKRPINLIAYHLDLTPYLETSLQLQLAHQNLSEKSRQLQLLSELVDDRLTSPLSGLHAVATHYAAADLKLASLLSQAQLDWISQDLKEVRALSEESLPVSLELCCQRAMQMLEVEIQISQVSFVLDLSAWNLIEYVPFFLEHLLYQLFRESLLLSPPTMQGGQHKISLSSGFDSTGQQLLNVELDGADLNLALSQPDSPLGQLKTLIESRGGKLECRSYKQNVSLCRIWL